MFYGFADRKLMLHSCCSYGRKRLFSCESHNITNDSFDCYDSLLVVAFTKLILFYFSALKLFQNIFAGYVALNDSQPKMKIFFIVYNCYNIRKKEVQKLQVNATLEPLSFIQNQIVRTALLHTTSTCKDESASSTRSRKREQMRSSV